MKPDAKTCLIVLILLSFGLLSLVGAAEQKQKENAATVEVRLTEYAIEMPQSLPAGRTTFVIHNQGKKDHRFVLAGEGAEERLAASLRPHATANLEVALKPGKYKVYCPIGSHEAKGMAMTLVVTGKQGG